MHTKLGADVFNQDKWMFDAVVLMHEYIVGVFVNILK
jgi:hypothetical protein